MPFLRDDEGPFPVIYCTGGETCPSWLRTYRLRRTKLCSAHTPKHEAGVTPDLVLTSAVGFLRRHRRADDPRVWELMAMLFPEYAETVEELLSRKALTKLRGD